MPGGADASPLGELLAVITGQGQQADGFLEVRYRHPDGMRTRFYPAGRVASARAIARLIARHGHESDIYLAPAIRSRQRGRRDDIAHARCLWAECDGPAATAAIEQFPLAPSLVVASGSPGNVHAYWALREPVGPRVLEDANRRLAHRLGADPACFDAARILRPPESFNHKHEPPRPVELIGPARRELFALAEVLNELPELPVPATPAGATDHDQRTREDRLLEISPRVYVPALAGAELGRDGKVSCPLHADRTPSLHAYPTPERGWYCYGCRQGGSIYDLASALYGWDTRGDEFLALKRELAARFL